jgi:hypothetical protein
MKKLSKPANTPKPVPKQPATKPLAAKPKVMVKSSPKPKPSEAQGQAELLPIVERLAHAAERLAQAAERLTNATTGDPAARAHEATTRENPAPDTVL